MSDAVIAAIISAASAAVISITALVTNARGFTLVGQRIGSIEQMLNQRIASIERRVEVLEGDVKGFRQTLYDFGLTLVRIENKIDHLAAEVAKHDEKLGGKS